MPIEFWRNHAIEAGAVADYSSQEVNYPAINCVDITALTKWRTTGKQSEYIVLSFAPEAGITHFGLWNTNLTDNASVTLYFSSSPNFSDPQTFNFSGSQIKNKLASLGNTYTYPYAKVLISDETNPSDYISIGQIWLCYEALEIAPVGFQEKLIRNDIYNQSFDFAGFRIARPALTKWNMSIRLTSLADYNKLISLITTCGTTIPFRAVFSGYPGGDKIIELCRIEETPEINLVYISHWTCELSLIEVK